MVAPLQDQRLIAEAEGYAELGLWPECWEAVESLPDYLRHARGAIRLRLRCCPALGAWELGEELAISLARGDGQDKKLAAGFWLDWARACPSLGRTCVASAIEAWPECEQLILKDALLKGFRIAGPEHQ